VAYAVAPLACSSSFGAELRTTIETLNYKGKEVLSMIIFASAYYLQNVILWGLLVGNRPVRI